MEIENFCFKFNKDLYNNLDDKIKNKINNFIKINEEFNKEQELFLSIEMDRIPASKRPQSTILNNRIHVYAPDFLEKKLLEDVRKLNNLQHDTELTLKKIDHILDDHRLKYDVIQNEQTEIKKNQKK